ncbi:MAG: peptide antibiotic transporter SbmA [Rhizobiales bacterium]|nr:peptide antibiotic transporter SbmA [Hyphomicrobiales bacterium]
MFRSFFPVPSLFFLSAVIWTTICFVLWFTLGDTLKNYINIGALLVGPAPAELPEGTRPPFFSADKLWTYQFILMATIAFCIFWAFFNRNIWYWWSVVGSAFLMVSTYFNVQISVWLNDWYGGFYDLIQNALTTPNTVQISDYYLQLSSAAFVLVPYITFIIMLDFFTSHYLFRWRMAMNNFYMENWQDVRHIEGASQRVQEDTRIFSSIMESLGISFVRSIMTLIAFLPLLLTLSEKITTYPLIGPVNGGLVYLAILSALLGTVVLAAVGYRLPGLEFENQKVEAAYRKELVYGEDHADRAEPLTAAQLFHNLRKFYFRYYFHYLYFNVARYAYLQGSVFIPFFALGPTIVTGVITFGLFQQVMNAFNQVEGAFQFLANSWTRIVELISVFKRLRAFELNIKREPLNQSMSLVTG